MWQFQVEVRYDPADVDHFISVADAIEEAFPSLVVDGVEAEGAQAFEVAAEDGRILFSQATEKRLPDPEELVGLLSAAGVRPGRP